MLVMYLVHMVYYLLILFCISMLFFHGRAMAKKMVRRYTALDEKLLKALREDSADDSAIEAEIKTLADDESLDYSDLSYVTATHALYHQFLLHYFHY